ESVNHYDVYNDLGVPDLVLSLARPVLGGDEHPYPRRCRTGRVMSCKDPLTGSRTLLPFYVPIDEDFSEIKEVTFGARTLYSVLHGVMPILDLVVTDKDKVFPLFTSIGFLFNQSVNVPAPDNGILSALPRLVKGEPDATNNINGHYVLEIDIHFVHDLVAARQVRVLHVPSRYQFADIFTKGLPSALFEEFRTSLSVRCHPAPTVGEYVEVTEKEIECMVMEASRVEYIANDKFNHQLGRRESSTPEPSYSGGTRSSASESKGEEGSVLCSRMQMVLSMGFSYV
ncbi:linoleate 13S-lipoxygenase 2-1, chloroplastic-like protein, partial [Tanacetum coccineum]